jgi:hypothetical protein
LFAFTECALAPLTVMPGFSKLDTKPYKVIEENAKAYWLAEERSILRSRLLNVHQLLLSDARARTDGVPAEWGYPVSPWNMIESIRRETAPRNHEISTFVSESELSGRVLNMHYAVEKPEMFTPPL